MSSHRPSASPVRSAPRTHVYGSRSYISSPNRSNQSRLDVEEEVKINSSSATYFNRQPASHSTISSNYTELSPVVFPIPNVSLTDLSVISRNLHTLHMVACSLALQLEFAASQQLNSNAEEVVSALSNLSQLKTRLLSFQQHIDRVNHFKKLDSILEHQSSSVSALEPILQQFLYQFDSLARACQSQMQLLPVYGISDLPADQSTYQALVQTIETSQLLLNEINTELEPHLEQLRALRSESEALRQQITDHLSHLQAFNNQFSKIWGESNKNRAFFLSRLQERQLPQIRSLVLPTSEAMSEHKSLRY